LNMNRTNEIQNTNPPANTAPARSGADTLEAALAHAAELAVEHGFTAEVFSQLALNAYATKSPEFREQMETAQLAAQLEVLRAQGRLGAA
ncbi:MAG: hypothetical protein ACM3ZE_30615, partial [Myxococcales bacterium]